MYSWGWELQCFGKNIDHHSYVTYHKVTKSKIRNRKEEKFVGRQASLLSDANKIYSPILKYEQIYNLNRRNEAFVW